MILLLLIIAILVGSSEASTEGSGALRTSPTPAPLAQLGSASSDEAGGVGTSPDLSSSGLTGWSTWYCKAGVSRCHRDYPDTSGEDLYAAAGPDIRAALGSSWRGRIVTVAARGRSVRVRLIDSCQCFIDLYADAFDNLTALRFGKLGVTVTLTPLPKPPDTSTR